MKKTSAGDRFMAGLATLGFVGHLPGMPGTWGSLAAALLAPLLFIPLPLTLKLMVLAAVFLAGSWACSAAERLYRRKDPGQAVIDELLGQWTAFLLLDSASVLSIALGFVLFRILDILKPFPIRLSESWLPGGYSVMLDDLLAGIYSLILLTLILELIIKPWVPHLL